MHYRSQAFSKSEEPTITAKNGTAFEPSEDLTEVNILYHKSP